MLYRIIALSTDHFLFRCDHLASMAPQNRTETDKASQFGLDSFTQVTFKHSKLSCKISICQIEILYSKQGIGESANFYLHTFNKQGYTEFSCYDLNMKETYISNVHRWVPLLEMR